MLRQEIAQQGPHLRDRFGRRLVVGAQLLYSSPLPIVFTIADIRPNMDPRLPAGTWTVDLHAEFPYVAGQGTPQYDLIGVIWPKAEKPAEKPEAPADTPAQEPAKDNLVTFPQETADAVRTE